MTGASPGMDAAGPDGGPSIRPFLGGGGAESASQGRIAGHSRALPDPTGLRPYVLTAGRVPGAETGIGPETQVVARTDRPTILSPELAAIVETCLTPLSVAEISARLGLHLGVARVLVGDLRAAGALHVHTRDSTEPHTPETILRVMRGLRAIG
jgi:Protein of unknown function (DUF742)